VHGQVRYGGSPPGDEELRAAVDELDAELDALAQVPAGQRRAAAARLAPAPDLPRPSPPGRPAPPAPTNPPEPVASQRSPAAGRWSGEEAPDPGTGSRKPGPNAGTPQPGPRAEATEPGPPVRERSAGTRARPAGSTLAPSAVVTWWHRRALRQRLLLAGLLLLVWSTAMVAVGASAEERLDEVYEGLRGKLGLSGKVRSAQHLARRRERAANYPADRYLWVWYADLATRHKQYGEAIIAYHHLLARHPADAELLNNLAWLLLTASDPLVRDAHQARILAERARTHAPDAPHITDTLAEALFQLGEREAAIALEQAALDRVQGPDRSFFERQLEKFRRAVPARPPATPDAPDAPAPRDPAEPPTPPDGPAPIQTP